MIPRMTSAAANPLLSKDRLERYRSVRARLDPTGDPAQAMAESYVAAPHSVSERIAAELALSPASKHLLIGGVGSGKTTELLAVQTQLSKLDEDLLGIYIDVSQRHDIAKMTPGAIIVQVGLALAPGLLPDEAAKAAFKQLTLIAYGAMYTESYGLGVSQKKDIPGVLIPPHRFANSVQDALPLVETLLVQLESARRRVVVLLDGLDRMSDILAFDKLIADDVNALHDLGVGVVLVGPLHALYGLDRTIAERFDSLHYQQWIDVVHDPKGLAFLTSVLAKRVSDDAFDGIARGHLIAASGGVIRDLLALAQSACVEAYVSGVEQVGFNEVAAAIDTFGRKHLQGLRPGEIEVLQRVRTKAAFVHTSEDDLALLMTRRVLEYRADGRLRYAVHPTIENLLAELSD